jgi:hypothetical protein
MKTAFYRVVSVLALVATLLFAVPAPAVTIYDNSVNDLTNRYNPGLLEVGDEVFVASTERLLTGFSFEYYALVSGVGSGVFSGTPKVQVKFYLNDGPLFNGYATPFTAFYTSGWIDLTPFGPTERATLVFDQWADFGGGFYLPIPTTPGANFTWSVQFKDLGGLDELGVDIYSPPVVGAAIGDYWEFTAGPGWQLKTNISGVPMNFAAKFDAIVPEPSSTALAVIGGLGLLAFRWRFRKA